MSDTSIKFPDPPTASELRNNSLKCQITRKNLQNEVKNLDHQKNYKKQQLKMYKNLQIIQDFIDHYAPGAHIDFKKLKAEKEQRERTEEEKNVVLAESYNKYLTQQGLERYHVELPSSQNGNKAQRPSQKIRASTQATTRDSTLKKSQKPKSLKQAISPTILPDQLEKDQLSLIEELQNEEKSSNDEHNKTNSEDSLATCGNDHRINSQEESSENTSSTETGGRSRNSAEYQLDAENQGNGHASGNNSGNEIETGGHQIQTKTHTKTTAKTDLADNQLLISSARDLAENPDAFIDAAEVIGETEKMPTISGIPFLVEAPPDIRASGLALGSRNSVEDDKDTDSVHNRDLQNSLEEESGPDDDDDETTVTIIEEKNFEIESRSFNSQIANEYVVSAPSALSNISVQRRVSKGKDPIFVVSLKNNSNENSSKSLKSANKQSRLESKFSYFFNDLNANYKDEGLIDRPSDSIYQPNIAGQKYSSISRPSIRRSICVTPPYRRQSYRLSALNPIWNSYKNNRKSSIINRDDPQFRKNSILISEFGEKFNPNTNSTNHQAQTGYSNRVSMLNQDDIAANENLTQIENLAIEFAAMDMANIDINNNAINAAEQADEIEMANQMMLLDEDDALYGEFMDNLEDVENDANSEGCSVQGGSWDDISGLGSDGPVGGSDDRNDLIRDDNEIDMIEGPYSDHDNNNLQYVNLQTDDNGNGNVACASDWYIAQATAVHDDGCPVGNFENMQNICDILDGAENCNYYADINDALECELADAIDMENAVIMEEDDDNNNNNDPTNNDPNAALGGGGDRISNNDDEYMMQERIFAEEDAMMTEMMEYANYENAAMFVNASDFMDNNEEDGYDEQDALEDADLADLLYEVVLGVIIGMS